MRRALYASLALVVIESIAAPFVVMATAHAAPLTMPESNTITASDVGKVLQTNTNPLEQPTIAATATGHGYVAASAGATVTMPTDTATGVSLAQPGSPTITVGLPNTAGAS